MGNPRSPLGFVDSLVAGKQFLLPLRAEPVEAGGKVVMDEHVLRAGDAHAGGLDAAAIVVVLAEPAAERLVQRPDTSEERRVRDDGVSKGWSRWVPVP